MTRQVTRDKIRVIHSLGAYDVQYLRFSEAMERLPDGSVIVTDENVWSAWGGAFRAGVPVYRVPAGEGSKCLERYSAVIDALSEAAVDRSATIVAIGGGVVGDLAGFVAATYMRGIPYVQVPTSLLAQVDSSVGGKVAIDTPRGKNLIGAFYPPQAVHIACETLDTLPERQYANGMAEVWKYGFIMDAGLVEVLSRSGARDAIEGVVRRCIELKASLVQADEFDRTGKRAVLNFGHTVGHALEKVTGYEALLHGEAVAVGMAIEADLGERIGLTARGTADTVRRCLASQGLPTTHEALSRTDALIDAMRNDKKALAGVPAFSLITRVGECKLVSDIGVDDVRAVLRA
jgi:3-dehydroquinate synthase